MLLTTVVLHGFQHYWTLQKIQQIW